MPVTSAPVSIRALYNGCTHTKRKESVNIFRVHEKRHCKYLLEISPCVEHPPRTGWITSPVRIPTSVHSCSRPKSSFQAANLNRPVRTGATQGHNIRITQKQNLKIANVSDQRKNTSIQKQSMQTCHLTIRPAFIMASPEFHRKQIGRSAGEPQATLEQHRAACFSKQKSSLSILPWLISKREKKNPPSSCPQAESLRPWC